MSKEEKYDTVALCKYMGKRHLSCIVGSTALNLGNLNYVVPVKRSNVWFEDMVISKTAKILNASPQFIYLMRNSRLKHRICNFHQLAQKVGKTNVLTYGYNCISIR